MLRLEGHLCCSVWFNLFHFTGEETDAQGLRDLAKVTLLMSGGAGIRAQSS